MAKNRHSAGSDEPEDGADRVRDECKGNGYDQQAGVQLSSCRAEEADVKIAAVEFAYAPHASDDEDNDEEEGEVVEQRVDAEHDEDGGIVAAEVAQVVVDPALGLAEVCWLRDALEVEELAQRAQIREARAQALAADGVEAGEVEARRQRVDGNADACHGVERGRLKRGGERRGKGRCRELNRS